MLRSPHDEAVAPHFSPARAAWIPNGLIWDDGTGELRGFEGPRGFASSREAVEASWFLVESLLPPAP
jgi:hypothetical protein